MRRGAFGFLRDTGGFLGSAGADAGGSGDVTGAGVVEGRLGRAWVGGSSSSSSSAASRRSVGSLKLYRRSASGVSAGMLDHVMLPATGPGAADQVMCARVDVSV